MTICRASKCSVLFDPKTTYAGTTRTRGPARQFCTQYCSAQFQEETGNYARSSALRVRYGISIDEYEAMWTAQDGMCAICKKPETTVTKNGHKWRLNVDHDHKTGEIRGLLCTPCNRGLGFLGDSAETMRQAISYLEDR